MSLQIPWIRDALTVFTEYMVSGAAPDKKQEKSIISNYQSVIVDLKNRLSGPLQAEEQLSMLVAVTFLGIYESFGTGEAEFVMAHFTAAAILFRGVLIRLSPRPLSPLHRIIFEVMLYNLAAHSMFCPVPGAAFNALGWILRQPALIQYNTTGGPAHHCSPHLGGNFEFHSLILRMAWFSCQHRGHEYRTQQVDAWLSELDHLDRRLRHYYDDAPPKTAEQLKAKYQLYSLALRIYCLEIRDHGLHANSSSAISLVSEAIKVYRQGHLHGTHAAAVSWPLLVLLRTCPNRASFHFFVQQIEKMETTFDRGHLRRLEVVVAELRHKHEEYANCAGDADHDNLGQFAHK